MRLDDRTNSGSVAVASKGCGSVFSDSDDEVDIVKGPDLDQKRISDSDEIPFFPPPLTVIPK